MDISSNQPGKLPLAAWVAILGQQHYEVPQLPEPL